MEIGDSGGHLNLAVTNLFNTRSQGPDWRAEADEFDQIDFEQVYQVSQIGPAEVEIFSKQRTIKVWQNESWLDVSAKLARVYNMPEWSPYRTLSVDGEYSRLVDSSDGEDMIQFESRQGRDYWYTNDHDESKDRLRKEGYLVEITGPDGILQTMATFTRWGIE
jgi:hypothetical protein